MNVFFTTPFSGKKHYQTFIDAIVATIRKSDRVITPEDTNRYFASLDKLQRQGLNKEQAHYAFIRQGIASADVVIIEATEEDIRVGHELTLALLFHKPTLILAQGKDFSSYITHDLLQGNSYETEEEAKGIVAGFLKNALSGRSENSMQTLDTSADSLHSIALARLRQLAKQEPGQFGEWAREADTNPEKVAAEIEKKLGSLKKQPAWAVFAPVYNEDSPDYIQSGVARFAKEILESYKIPKDALVVEAACGTAALARQLVSQGFSKIKAFDNSRPMLSEAFRLSAGYPNIELFEADIRTVSIDKPAAAVVWTDYSSNFALNPIQLEEMVSRLVNILDKDGILVFDIRTFQGWQIDFYSQPITIFATERFHRIWLNHQDTKKNFINFDVFIRTRDPDGAWSDWKRESMTEKMWYLREVLFVVEKIKGVSLEGVYRDDFRKIDTLTEEPNLAYFVIKKH
ncbi:MAG: class I SAM-dependent methyltransferase [bacterium]|nr:class I SAM-dependent methyltransferase [bacterium]